MSMFRIALANLRFPRSPQESVQLAQEAIDRAGVEGAQIVCFPECFVPGYRAATKSVPAPNQAFLESTWSAMAATAAKSGVVTILGTERIIDSSVELSHFTCPGESHALPQLRLGKRGFYVFAGFRKVSPTLKM